MSNKFTSSRKGFTLIEMLISLTLLSVLITTFVAITATSSNLLKRNNYSMIATQKLLYIKNQIQSDIKQYDVPNVSNITVENNGTVFTISTLDPLMTCVYTYADDKITRTLNGISTDLQNDLFEPTLKFTLKDNFLSFILTSKIGTDLHIVSTINRSITVQGSSTLTLPSYPDLIITGITTEPVSPIAGVATAVYATIRNQGFGVAKKTDSTVPINIVISRDSYEFTCFGGSSSPIEKDSSVQVLATRIDWGSEEWTPPILLGSGTYTINAYVNSNNQIDEVNRTNNSFQGTITVN